MYYEKAADTDGYLKFSKRTPSGRRSRIVMPHFHNSAEMYVCVKGKYCVYINGENHTIEEGEIAFVDRLTPHAAGSLVNDTPSEVYFVIASNYYLNGIKWLEEETLPAFTKKKEGFERIANIVSLATETENMNEDMRRGFITLLFGMLKDYCGTVARTASKNNELVVEVMSYINEHITENITLDSLSRHFGYEKTYFSRVFNKFLGINLREYLNRYRIGEAVRMKRENPTMAISKIAETCGFDSPNTYYRALKKYGEEKHNF
jgi:AraC-like DNA-binding protein